MKINQIKVQSSENVSLSVYKYSPDHEISQRSPTKQILFSHANGFHGRCFDPVIESLVSNFNCVSFDLRGHGDSQIDPTAMVSWRNYGNDALSVANSLPKNLIGVGHSMGGAALVMAALKAPELFRALIIYEPIIFPSEMRQAANSAQKPSPLVEGARRRRNTFASRQEAFANYASKPPMNVFEPSALQAYVDYGFKDEADSIVLKCSPELEARNFEMGLDHDTSDHLSELQVPTWVVSGLQHPTQPSGFAARIAEQIKSAKFIEWPDLGHFGPMQQPSRFADLIRQVDDLTSART